MLIIASTSVADFKVLSGHTTLPRVGRPSNMDTSLRVMVASHTGGGRWKLFVSGLHLSIKEVIMELYLGILPMRLACKKPALLKRSTTRGSDVSLLKTVLIELHSLKFLPSYNVRIIKSTHFHFINLLVSTSRT